MKKVILLLLLLLPVCAWSDCYSDGITTVCDGVGDLDYRPRGAADDLTGRDRETYHRVDRIKIKPSSTDYGESNRYEERRARNCARGYGDCE